MSPRQPSHSQPARPTFEETSRYKLIYVYAIDDKPHEGYLKIGETTVVSPLEPDDLPPNCDLLKEAARERIDGETQTAGVDYRLLYTELAVRTRTLKNKQILCESFSDKKVHAVLKNSGIPHKYIGNTKGREWYGTDLKTVKAAIAAVKAYRGVLSGGATEPEEPIVFRDEQNDAIAKTLERFKTHSDMLWDAKMRFGKTLAALQLVREAKGRYRRVIIVTHRPVVGGGWQEDFRKLFTEADGYDFFVKDALASGYEFNGRAETQNDKALAKLDASGARFIYFASIQDLRGSQAVGGKFAKNRGVFDMDWDLVIVDEAHEGTQTDLGKEVSQLLVKKHTKVLSLSGTPFNILSQYDEDAVFVWDYVMEQKRKDSWENDHPDEPNPYAILPRLNLYTYDLGSEIQGYTEEDLEGKAFKFREFFRTWTGDRDLDYRPVPRDARVGDFVHAEDVRRFLDLISGDSSTSRYPFATPQHRDLFRHTLWIVPGVAAAKALSALLRTHPYFKRCGIANVAGEGDDYEQRHFDNALELVRKTIRENESSITLSCGKLTTGVTVPEWTAVLMLSGATAVSAAQYMQTIFRVQSPGDLGGRMKTNCYAFDFAPDRALKVIAETVQVSRRLSKSSAADAHGRGALGEFLNFCPVIAISGTKMEPYDVRRMMASIKHIFVTKTIRNGFDDASLYSPRLLELKDIDLKKFENLRQIVGTSKQTKAADTVYVNEQDFDDEQRAKGPDKRKREPTPEEKAAREELKRRREERRRAISILRAISIRMPLLIYGADVPIEKVISISEFPDLVDDESWKEFMPRGVTKALFKTFVEYYDPDVFAAAGTQIRKLAKSADQLPPTRRVQQIARIFSYFKNPDKETVLTPWRVVNMHLADTIGGWCFWDENYENPLEDAPRHVLRPGVTQDVFAHPDARILEINSKSGLYPLYVAYSLYRRKLGDIAEDAVRPRELERHWRQVVAESLFIVCKTPMARAITRRTLVGYTDATVNTLYIENLVGLIQKSPHQFSIIVTSAKAWQKEGSVKYLEFDATVGNPPYQLMGGSGGTNDAPIFQYFCQAATSVRSRYVSMIIPAKWFAAGRESQLKAFREKMLTGGHLRHLFAYSDSHALFPTAEIKGGVCYYLEDRDYNGKCQYTLNENGKTETAEIALDAFPVFIRNPHIAAIVRKVRGDGKMPTVSSIISADTPFGIPTNPASSKKTPFAVNERKTKEFDTILFYWDNGKRATGYVRSKDIKKNVGDIASYKVFIPKAGGSGADPYVLGQPEVAPKNSVCSQTYLYVKFGRKQDCEHFASYLKTRFCRFLVSALKITQDALARVYNFVPMQDFTSSSDIDWSLPIPEIDKQLYEKYSLTKPERAFIESMIKPME